MVDDADPDLDLDLLAASLRADGTESATFAQALAAKLLQALPDATRVRRGGMFGRGEVQEIDVEAGGERLGLRVARGTIQTTAARVSGGIVLKTETVAFEEWLRRLTAALAEQAGRSERTRQALERLLNG